MCWKSQVLCAYVTVYRAVNVTSGGELPAVRNRGKRARIVSPLSVPDNGLVGEGSGMGAPTVSSERLDSHESVTALKAVVDLGASLATFPRFWQCVAVP
jgi:Protein of unknown function (DUF917)